MTHTNVDQLHPRVQLVNDDGTPTHFFLRWLQATWEKHGGPDDFINRQSLRELYPRQNYREPTEDEGYVNRWQINRELEQQFNYPQSVDLKRFELISTGVDITTTGNEKIIATSNITVALNANPEDDEEVIIKRNTAAGGVIVSSSPINIDGAATYTLIVNYEGAHLVYSVIDNEWFII